MVFKVVKELREYRFKVEEMEFFFLLVRGVLGELELLYLERLFLSYWRGVGVCD